MPDHQRYIHFPVLSLFLVSTIVLTGSARALSRQLRSPQPFLASESPSSLKLTEALPSLFPTTKQTRNPQLLEAEQLEQRANQLDDAGQTQAAIPLWLRSLALYRQLGDRIGETRSLGYLGIAFHALGDYPKAVQYLEAFLPLVRERRARNAEAFALTYLGNAYLSLNEYRRAVERFTAALPILQEMRDAELESFAHVGLGNAFEYSGQFSQALESYQAALNQAQQLRSPKGQNITLLSLLSLGTIYDRLGNYEQANTYHERALRLAREGRNSRLEGRALNGLGGVHYSLDDYNTAKNYFEQAIAIAQQTGDQEGESNALTNLGTVQMFLGESQAAVATYERSLAIERDRNSRQGSVDTLSNLAVAYGATGNFNRGLALSQEAIGLARQLNNPLSEGNARNISASLLFRMDRLTEAETQLRETARLWANLRQDLSDGDRITLFERQQTTYDSLQAVLVQQNQPEAALEAAEQGRAQAFITLLSQRLSGANSAGRTANFTIAEMQQIARQRNATLVEYSVIPKLRGQADLFIWVVQPNGNITFRKQVMDTPLRQLVTFARTEIGVRGVPIWVRPNQNTQALSTVNRFRQLHQLLIQPIADQLPADPNSPIIFVPHRELFLVPFAALQDANGTALIEQHTILTTPALQVLNLTQQQRTRARQANRQDVVLVGNPTMPQIASASGALQPLRSLPGAQQEAAAIANLFNTQPLTSNQATKTAVLRRLPNARIIHLATHGLLNDRQPLESAIALAPDSSNNGLLTAAELLQLNLAAELAVLSACDTGQGRITGDGVIGLSRSLITAGVPSVIVSLWAVPDAPTAELMTEFYRQWGRSGNKAQALRQAMLVIRSNPQYANPRNWAAFTLIGEAQ